MATRADTSHNGRRRRTTLPLDRELLARAQEELGTSTITETVESALRRVAAGKPRVATFRSGKTPVARDEQAMLKGFGER